MTQTANSDLAQKLAGKIDRSELAQMLLDLVEIPSPTGGEEAVARYLGQRFAELGMDIKYQEMEPGRPNVIATLRGTGGGPSLTFNGHMDTSTVAGDEGLKNQPGLQSSGFLEDEWIHGPGASNMKAAFPSYYGAIKALQQSGVKLKGDVVVAGVVGEIEKAPIDQYQGCAFRGGGSGTRWLVMQGATSDVAIIGEPTGLRVQPGNTGYLFVKISTFGIVQHTWSKELGIDAIAKMRKVIERLEAWEPIYEQRHPHPLMRPRIGIGAIQGGMPYKPSLVPAPFCYLYMHVTMVPKQSIEGVKEELREILNDLAKEDPEFKYDLEVYLSRNGYELSLDHPLIKTVERAHRGVFDADPVYPERNRYAVSSDCSTYDEYGIPSMTYGPGGINRQRQYSMYDPNLGEILSVTNMVDCARVYALAAADLCGRDREQWLSEVRPFNAYTA